MPRHEHVEQLAATGRVFTAITTGTPARDVGRGDGLLATKRNPGDIRSTAAEILPGAPSAPVETPSWGGMGKYESGSLGIRSLFTV